MIIKTISDRCNMTYENYFKLPMHTIGRNINMNIDKTLQLLNSADRTK